MHKDTKFDLRKCERGSEPQNRMAVDLTQNYKFAKAAVAVADRFFQFDFSKVYFSGFAQEDEEIDYQGSETLRVEIWKDASLLYGVDFLMSGLQGILHVELLAEPEIALQKDLLRVIRQTINKEQNLTFDLPRIRSAEVHPDHITLCLELLP